ncbi:MAG: DUF4367 domain-containing protein [Bacillota bacterium]|nr:DUF4367 domain-containing protein [Bacillota bacterium]
MKCPTIDILQAYIDGELDIACKKDIESHIVTCEKCGAAYRELKENDNIVFGAVIKYKQYMDENINPVQKPFKAKGTSLTNRRIKSEKKGFVQGAYKYRKIAAAVITAMLITTCISVQPIRAAVSNVLSIFRTDSMTGIHITAKDIMEIQDQLRSKTPNIDLKDMGHISYSGGQQKHITLSQLKDITDIKVQLPGSFKDLTPDITVAGASSMSFNFNVPKVNSIIKSFGVTEFLPESINGKTFQLNTPEMVNLSYIINGISCSIVQTGSPEIIVPEGVDADSLYKSMTKLPFIPENIQKQLTAYKDWKTTIMVPVFDQQTEEVSINGTVGYLYSQPGNKSGIQQSELIWYDNGTIRAISASLSRDELLSLAESMR